MTLNTRRPARAGAMPFIVLLLSFLTSACAGGLSVQPNAATREFHPSLAEARDAGLKLYDALRPIFADGAGQVRYRASLGPEQLASTACEARYQARALRARCAALSAVISVTEGQTLLGAAGVLGYGQIARMLNRFAPSANPILGQAGARLAAAFAAGQGGVALSDPTQELIAALRADAPALFALGRAARAQQLEAADFDWLAQMDEVFDRANGRSLPVSLNDRSRFEQINRRIDAMLKRPEPGYGAASLFDVMADQGRQLASSDIAVLSDAVIKAEQALARFDRIAVEWRAIASAIDDYDALLAAAGDRVATVSNGGGVEGRLAALFNLKASAASLLSNLTRIGAVQ